MFAPPRRADYSTTTASTNSFAFAFHPPISSPLSPRSANIHGRHPAYMSSPDNKTHARTLPQSENHSASYQLSGNQGSAKRAPKKAPSPRQDDLRETRRRLFLRNVREGREDKRWEHRGEDIMRLDFMQRQRAWEAEQARDAPYSTTDSIEEEEEDEDEDAALYELPSSSSRNTMQMLQSMSQGQPMPEQEEEELDAVLRREQEEMEALLSYMPIDEPQSSSVDVMNNAQSFGNLWSDDDYYDDDDAFCSDVVVDGNGSVGHAGPTFGELPADSTEEMDLS
ncbi:hypothetical protein LTR91_000765 [Friedmanniomyces endolithicus]|uniref:Uncharacterized protein n=3 Tax=Dothideomycetidae TaxID=451867 RepID=A0AAN6L438_9PEZI|nr:hypothetical protein LTR94_001827 [Friedmanniomyces endolithicus]KAK5147854.1 hypothetical protein LTR32_000780 [Rachicladosporium monterosium]KAK0797527.1 hypothetical protein LTR59_006732 [Friedmanniomyces endolithicus]KAK0817112.1 hypothetical protein LTR38_001748 [Friedmanniomyces endolithicus]KAK0852833.1 hypothetical protein LTR03_003267 [Friedmanniomyces endolithicus]